MFGSIALHIVLLFLFSPLLGSIIAKTKAVIGGRSGPPILQPYYDLLRLFRKEMVISRTTTWVFRVGPLLGIAVPILASLLLPFGPARAILSFQGDFVLFIYLLALSRFFTVLAALDTGSSFEGMGAAREVTFAILVEPTIFVAFIVLARTSGSFSLDGMLAAQHGGIFHAQAGIPLALTVLCLFIVLLAENCRIPFDDPNTHLELTMIHEVMVLDHSGPDLGLILYGAAMKLTLFAGLIANIIVPAFTYSLSGYVVYILTLITLAVAVGLVESGMARLRLIRVPQLLIGTTLLSFFALILLLR